MDKKEARRLWVEALRSGEYKQGTGKLETRTDEGELTNCCLGVACRAAHKWGVFVDMAGERILGNYLDSQPSVKEWLGLKDCRGFYKINCWDTLNCLAYDNDIHGLSFHEIADIIESEPEGLFDD